MTGARGTGRLSDEELEKKRPGRARRMAEMDAKRAAGVEYRTGKPRFTAGSPEAKQWAKEMAAKSAAVRKQRKADEDLKQLEEGAHFVKTQAATDARIGRATLRVIAQNTRLKPSERLRAAEILLAYGEGKPKETVETTGSQTLNVILSPKMLAAHAPALEEGNGTNQGALPPATG